MPYSTPSTPGPARYLAWLTHPNTGGAEIVIDWPFNGAMSTEAEHDELFQRFIDALDAAGIVVSGAQKSSGFSQTVTVTP